MSLIGSAGRTAGKMTPWGRAIIIGEIALTAKRHLDHLDAGEPTELRKLIAKSKGRPKNLTEAERKRFFELVKKLEPGAFAKHAARSAVPFGRKR